MNSPKLHDMEVTSPVPVRKARRGWLRRHWLTGALLLGLSGFLVYTGHQFYQTELRLAQVRRTRAELEARLHEARQRNEALKEQLAQVNQDSYMELMARSLGYVYPHETVYKQGVSKR